MAASAILRNARLVLKFMVDGSSYESVMKNVRSQISLLLIEIGFIFYFSDDV